VRVLIAPDKFKGTLGAGEAADAIREGVLAALPSAEVRCLPLADGGEGTLEVLIQHVGGSITELAVEGAGGRFVAPVGLLADGSICVEVASTSGTQEANALDASSLRTGETLVALYGRRPTCVLVAVGGSASTDAGTGIAVAHGWRFFDEAGVELPLGGGALRDLHRFTDDEVVRPDCELLALCDVANPLVGTRGAAHIFGPQKGASLGEVEVLDVGLQRWAEVVRAQLGRDLAHEPRAGAGGGIAAGLVAFLGARPVDGFEHVADALELDAALEDCDLVVTGEGKLDRGSLSGKVTSGVARRALAAGVPCAAVCGEVALTEDQIARIGLRDVSDAVSSVGREEALRSPRKGVAVAAQRLIASGRWRM
jgi:glycerate 2-kinase